MLNMLGELLVGKSNTLNASKTSRKSMTSQPST